MFSSHSKVLLIIGTYTFNIGVVERKMSKNTIDHFKKNEKLYEQQYNILGL